MDISSDLTTISIKKTTRDALKEVGKKSETYDEVILRLVDSFKKQETKRK